MIADSQRASLGSRPNPHARASRDAERLDAERGGGLDHGLFELPHIPDHVAANFAELQNRIADNLSRAVVGDIAAAIGVMKLDAHLREQVIRSAQILAACRCGRA